MKLTFIKIQFLKFNRFQNTLPALLCFPIFFSLHLWNMGIHMVSFSFRYFPWYLNSNKTTLQVHHHYNLAMGSWLQLSMPSSRNSPSLHWLPLRLYGLTSLPAQLCSCLLFLAYTFTVLALLPHLYEELLTSLSELVTVTFSLSLPSSAEILTSLHSTDF